MTLRLVLRALLTRPVRSALLAGGFGFGIAVMAILLGVGEVVLEQARAPELEGGGELVITGVNGPLSSARHVIAGLLRDAELEGRIAAHAPSQRSTLYLIRDGEPLRVFARGGVPSLERAIEDPEVLQIDPAVWSDTARDAEWIAPRTEDVLRAMDGLHQPPDAPRWRGSWAEWLYFNGRHGDDRFYLSFMFGAPDETGERAALVRLQLERNGRRRAYSAAGRVPEEAVAAAPDLAVGGNIVRLEGSEYRIRLDLRREADAGAGLTARPHHADDLRGGVRGEVVLDADVGASLPPITIRGRDGWVSGYVVPVLSAKLTGTLTVDGETWSVDGGRGYHDHNWGFWEGVSWRWGQVAHEEIAIVYGRIHPPAEAADPGRMPNFLAVLGPDGPLAFSTAATIDEIDDPSSGDPQRITVAAYGADLDVALELEVLDVIRSDLPGAESIEFLQLQARYRVRGTAGGRELDFTATGSAETFRGR